MKKLFREYRTYGNNSGEELTNQYVCEDTTQFRKELVDENDDTYSGEDFINMKTNTLYFELTGGDWDDPTGGYIVVKTKEEMLNEIEAKYKQSIKKLEEQFED